MMKRTEIKGKPIDTESLLQGTAVKLRDTLSSLELNGDGEHEATVKGIARLSGAIAAICGELRQHAKGKARALAEFSLDDIVAHLRSLPKGRRDEAFTLAFGADESEPLL